MPNTLPVDIPAREAEAPADWTELMLRAYALGDMINRSATAEDYAYWKQVVGRDAEVQAAAAKLARAKEKFAECERFGRFHPDYHEALDRVYAVQAELDALEPVRRFKAAERELDEMFREISFLLARAVSESVKVPDGDPKAGSGCGGGGSCSCGSGGCG